MSAVDIPREDLLALLASIGVVLPSNTKISEEDLKKRLSHALDAAQQFHATFASTPVIPSAYPIWKSDKTLLDAVKRGNTMEAFRNAMSHAPRGVSSAKKDTFIKMRQIVMGLADGSDKGQTEFCLMDKTQEWGVYVRVIQIHNVKETPLFTFVYKEVRSSVAKPLSEVLEDLVHGVQLVAVHTTELERLAMLKLFRLNSKRLPSDYHPMKEARKLGMKASFVLPLGPIGMRELGKITNDSGCEVCGKRNFSRCVQCLSVAYCSKECQKADWQNHKVACRSLQGGTWRTIPFEKPSIPGARIILNRLDTLNKVKTGEQIEQLGDGRAPPNVYDSKIFLVKIQISLFSFGDAAHILIYDRQKSFQVVWRRNADPDLFDDAEEIMGDKLKMYRYARRIGDFELSICLDRSPSQEPAW